MTESYENLSLFKRLNELCLARGIVLDPEPGSRISFRGHPYVAAAAQDDALALLDDLCAIPLDPDRIVVVNAWENDPNCFFLPSLEQLLEIIYQRSSLYPIMTPGFKETRPVWQVSHPGAPPLVSKKLETGLLELAIRILEKE